MFHFDLDVHPCITGAVSDPSSGTRPWHRAKRAIFPSILETEVVFDHRRNVQCCVTILESFAIPAHFAQAEPCVRPVNHQCGKVGSRKG
jgi:hypothetical protein